MSDKDDEFAFPRYVTAGGRIAGGMSLRDYFAAAALTGLLAAEKRKETVALDALAAYSFADAMIEMRSK